MNRTCWTCFATVILLIVPLAPRLDASVLQKQIVAADATRLVHFDMDAFLRSRIGEHLTNNPDTYDFMRDVEEMEQETGVNMLRDLHAITVYGANDNDVVVAVAGSANLDKALDRLQQEPGYSQLQVDGYVIHRLQPEIDEGDDADADDDEGDGGAIEPGAELEIHADVERDDLDVDPWASGPALIVRQDAAGVEFGLSHGESFSLALLPGVDQSQRMAFIASTPELVVRGIKVYEKKLPNLADHPESALKASPRAGSVVFVAIAGLGEMVDGVELDSEVAGVARRAKQITFDAGEAQDSFYAAAEVDAANEEDARNLAQVAQGLIALVNLMGGDDPDLAELKKLTSGLSITNEANRIAAELRISSEEMIKHLRKSAEHDHGQ